MEWAIVKRERERVCLRAAMAILAASVRTKRSSARCHCICFSLFLYANSPFCFNCLRKGVVIISCMGELQRQDWTGGGEKKRSIFSIIPFTDSPICFNCFRSSSF